MIQNREYRAGIIRADDDFEKMAKIKVVGIGGAGGNAVNRMVSSGFGGVEFIAINTDSMALSKSLADCKIAIGQNVTRGLGAGAKPDVGLAAIQEDRTTVAEKLKGADMVFITAGMGGGTGTGGAPEVAAICRELGILSVAVVTRPFIFEGPVRERNCKMGIETLRKSVDTIIVIQNQKILMVADRNTSYKHAMNLADEVLTNAVRGISEIFLGQGDIQVDFADVKTIMQNGGDAIMGTGIAEGDNRAIIATEKAINSPLLDDISIAGASGILVNITGGEDLGIKEVEEVMNHIYHEVGEESRPNIIFGTVINSEFNNRISVTVIATGFPSSAEPANNSTPCAMRSVQAPTTGHFVAPPQIMQAAPVQKVPSDMQTSAYQSHHIQSSEAKTPVSSNPVTIAQPVPQRTMDTRAQLNAVLAPLDKARESARQPASFNAIEELDVRQVDRQEFKLEEAEKPAFVSPSRTATKVAETMPFAHQDDFSSSPYGDEDVDWETPTFLRNPER